MYRICDFLHQVYDALSKRAKIIASSFFIITLVTVSAAFIAHSFLYSIPANSNGVQLQLLDNGSVMIEAEELYIDIDPINLPPSYQHYPADSILTTHPHDAHYQTPLLNILQKNGTLTIFPTDMATETRGRVLEIEKFEGKDN